MLCIAAMCAKPTALTQPIGTTNAEEETILSSYKSKYGLGVSTRRQQRLAIIQEVSNTIIKAALQSAVSCPINQSQNRVGLSNI